MRYLFLMLVCLPASVFAKWSTESELAYLQSGGNSEVSTTNAKTSNVNEWTLNKVRYGGHYIYGENADTVSARNWDVNLKYERELSERTALTFGEILEGNKFNGIKVRYNTDLGARYYHIKSDAKNVFTEVTYRYTIEDRYAPAENAYDNKGRLYNEINQKLSESVQYKIWIEYIPNFTRSKDYMINGEASITSIINSIFSLKFAYAGFYDNEPSVATFKNYDYNTSTSLVVKF
jgi:putative salt-induced outer membrane protein